MTPRNQLATSAYAFNAETIDGLDSSAFGQLSTNNTWTGDSTFTKNAGNFVISNHSLFDVTSDGVYITGGGDGINITGNVVSNGQFIVGGPASWFTGTTSTTRSFSILGTSSEQLFNSDTTNNRIVIGDATADATGIVLVLDTKNTSGDPTGINGAMYYNSNAGKLRCYQASAWTDCIGTGGGGSGTLQDSYDNSSSPATITTSSGTKGISIAAGAAPTADLFSISNSGQAVATSNVNGLRIDYVGGSGVIDASGAKVSLTPGGTSGSTWNGVTIAANVTGAVSGVTENGIKLTGPTSPGAGTEVGLTIDANWDVGIQFGTKSGQVPTPPTDNLYVYSSKWAGRDLLTTKNPNGNSYALQPSLFSRRVALLTPSNTTSVQAIGGLWTTQTTLSHASWNENYGFGTTFTVAATTNSQSGAYMTNLEYGRGTTSSGAGGFFSVARIATTGTTYGSGATGSRIAVGMSNQLGTVLCNNDDNASHAALFMYSTPRNDINWQFQTKDGTTQNVIDTGMAFAASKQYDMYIYTPPGGSSIYWRIDNLTDGTSQQGSTSSNLPDGSTALRPAVIVRTLEAFTRVLQLNYYYNEAGR